MRLAEAAEPGGHWGQMPLHFLYLGKKCPFSGMKVPYFHRIEVPFLQNLSALFGQCPLTFEVLPRPLETGTNVAIKDGGVSILKTCNSLRTSNNLCDQTRK